MTAYLTNILCYTLPLADDVLWTVLECSLFSVAATDSSVQDIRDMCLSVTAILPSNEAYNPPIPIAVCVCKWGWTIPPRIPLA